MSNVENNIGEIVMYQPDETIRLEVRLENETVWLTTNQMAVLFGREESNIRRHIINVFKEGELERCINVQNIHVNGVKKPVPYYSLDVIISVGYRVKSQRGTKFRQWANRVLKDYLLSGYAINQQMKIIKDDIDNRFWQHEKRIEAVEGKIDFFVRSSLPPVEGVLFEGQIFDAYKLVEALIKSAQHEIVLIDNYIDATIFDLLEKREQGVGATIYTEHVGQSLTHLQQLNQQQYGRRIEVKEYNSRFHDRFLILDDNLYHFGASFKDLGKRLFAFELMGIDKNIILSQL